MVRLFLRHPVSDFAVWRKAYDEFGPERAGLGVTGESVFQEVAHPNIVTMTHDFASLKAAKAFVNSEGLKAAMAAGGVAGPPEVWFTTPIKRWAKRTFE